MDNFFDFLNKMDSDSEGISKRVEEEQPQDFKQDFEDEEFEDQEVNEEVENEDNHEEEEERENMEEEEDDDDDIIEKSLDYAKSVLKVVKENFKGKDQKIMFETLRNTLNMYLGETQQTSYQPRVEQSSAPTRSEIKNETASPMLKGSTMTEEEWNRLDTNNLDAADIYNQGKQIPVDQLAPKTNGGINESRSRSYSKELPLAVRVNANGKPEVDLSKITSRDMDDMKVLMGLK